VEIVGVNAPDKSTAYTEIERLYIGLGVGVIIIILIIAISAIVVVSIIINKHDIVGEN
jgi:hypothetical protein